MIQLVAALYIAVLIGLTFFPSSPIDPSGGDPHVNLQPFATIRPALRLGLNSVPGRLVLGNIAAFVPVGLLLPLLTRRGNTWLLVLVVALALSIAIELGQLALSIVVGYAYRTADVDDVILNVTGAMLGYLAYAALTFPLRRKRTDRTAPKG